MSVFYFIVDNRHFAAERSTEVSALTSLPRHIHIKHSHVPTPTLLGSGQLNARLTKLTGLMGGQVLRLVPLNDHKK